ncbi:hypothetical protein KQI36_14045 [Clostridium senegalense]|uniref:hypothetical protein n=1 Tax=Clostridium senegalense TaxID=1465809 RepID=UPI001C0F9A4D|nr:hypothetical protein [Clostridium senegalense]MBU5227753.1 hypothetical protein [Clostridium senegalense]
MSKIFVILIAFSMLFSLVGCTNKNEKVVKSEVNQEIEEKVKDEIVTYPKDFKEELGEGTIIVSTPDGNGETGLIPIVHTQADVKIMQIDLTTSNFDEKKISYIFIDEKLVEKGNFGESKVSLNLTDENLVKGTHKIEVIQFEDNDASKKPIVYKSAKYEVKEA